MEKLVDDLNDYSTYVSLAFSSVLETAKEERHVLQ